MAVVERSAGVIVFRVQRGAREYLLLDYSKHWDFPKGHIERGESRLQAALRELTEETALSQVRLIDGFAQEISYYFRDRKRNLINKSVWFCLGETAGGDITLSHEHVGWEFLPFEAAMKRLTFAGARNVLRDAENFMLQRT